MDAPQISVWAETPANASIGTLMSAPIEIIPVPIEVSTESQRCAPLEKKARKPRCYKQRFGDFCPICNIWFTTATSRKKTCSESCKSRLKRQRQKVQQTGEQILWALGDLQKMIQTTDKVQKKKAKITLLNIYQQVIMTCEEVGLKPCQR